MENRQTAFSTNGAGTLENPLAKTRKKEIKFKLNLISYTNVSREQHRNMYIIYGETDHQPRLDS